MLYIHCLVVVSLQIILPTFIFSCFQTKDSKMKTNAPIQTSLHQSPVLNTGLSDMLLKDQKYLCVSWASFARGAVSSGRSTVLLHAAWHTLSWMCTYVKPSSLNSMPQSMLQQYTLSYFVHLCPVKSQPSHSQQGQIPCCDMDFFQVCHEQKSTRGFSIALWMVIVFEGDDALKLQSWPVCFTIIL